VQIIFIDIIHVVELLDFFYIQVYDPQAPNWGMLRRSL